MIFEKLQDFISNDLTDIGGIPTLVYKTKVGLFNVNEIINLYKNKKFLDLIKEKKYEAFSLGVRFILFVEKNEIMISIFPQEFLHTIFLNKLKDNNIKSLQNKWVDYKKEQLLFQGVYLNKDSFIGCNLPASLSMTSLWQSILDLKYQSIFLGAPIKVG